MLALFVSPCKMPKPKLRGEVLSQGGFVKERMEHPVGFEPTAS